MSRTRAGCTFSGVADPRDERPNRRTVLALGAGLTFSALAGCGSQTRDRESTGRLTPDPDVTIAERALGSEAVLLVYLASLIRAHHDLARAFAPYVAVQREHVRALTAALTDPPAVSTTRRVDVSRSATIARDRAVRLIARAQRARRAEALAADSNLLARLLASISASHAVGAASYGGGPA
jgi:hypothetical protein